MAARAPLFAAEKKKLMARHHIDEAEAERAIIRGFVRLAELAGAPVDAEAVTLESVHEALTSGLFAELERRAKARHPAPRAASAAGPASESASPPASEGASPPAAKRPLVARPTSAARLDPRRTPVKPPRKP